IRPSRAVAVVARRVATAPTAGSPSPSCFSAAEPGGTALAPFESMTAVEGSVARWWTQSIVLVFLWVFGRATAPRLGHSVHLLLVLAFLSLVYHLIHDRTPDPRVREDLVHGSRGSLGSTCSASFEAKKHVSVVERYCSVLRNGRR